MKREKVTHRTLTIYFRNTFSYHITLVSKMKTSNVYCFLLAAFLAAAVAPVGAARPAYAPGTSSLSTSSVVAANYRYHVKETAVAAIVAGLLADGL